MVRRQLRTFATSRTINLTSCPWAASAAAVCEPVKPVPPVTSTFTVGMLEVETAIHSRMKKCRGAPAEAFSVRLTAMQLTGYGTVTGPSKSRPWRSTRFAQFRYGADDGNRTRVFSLASFCS